MRDSESQMQRAPVHVDLMIFTIESIKDLEPRYYSFKWRSCCSCATNMKLDSSRISELLQEPTFFLLRQRSDSDQHSGVHRACCYHHHRSMACWPTAQTMAANDVRRRLWQSRQNASCRISNSRCEFQTILYRILNAIWWFVVRGSWSSFFMYLQYYVLQYRNFLKILSDDFAHALSSGLTSKMPRRRTLLRLTAKETAHVNAIS